MNWHVFEPRLQLFAEVDVILAKGRGARRQRRRVRSVRLQPIETRTQDDGRVIRIQRRKVWRWVRRGGGTFSKTSGSGRRVWKVRMRRRPRDRVQVDGRLVHQIATHLDGQADQRLWHFKFWHFGKK
jgi:hypothetical protein